MSVCISVQVNGDPKSLFETKSIFFLSMVKTQAAPHFPRQLAYTYPLSVDRIHVYIFGLTEVNVICSITTIEPIEDTSADRFLNEAVNECLQFCGGVLKEHET